MEFATNLFEIAVISVAATIAVALLARLSGSKPNWRRMFAIAIGLVVAQAIQLHWSLSTAIYALVVGVCTAACVLLSLLFGRHASPRT